MKIKEEGIVLLKNKDNTLPLNTGEMQKSMSVALVLQMQQQQLQPQILRLK